MRIYLLTILMLFQSIAFAHKSDFLHIDDMKVLRSAKQEILIFEIQNLAKTGVEDLRVELLVNGLVMSYINIQSVPNANSQQAQILIPSYLNIKETDLVQLKISKINGVLGAWSIDDVPYTHKQYDDVGSYELFADAPWRMDIYDASNNKNAIPIHLVLHDGDGFSYPWLQYVDISFKKSTDASFGAPISLNSLTAAQFNALFSSKSTADASLDRKSFDASLAVKDANHTIAFRENYYNPWFGSSYYYTSLQNFLWYATINIPASVIAGYLDTDYLDVKVEFTIRNTFFSNPITYLRIFRQAESVPSLTDWYRGDTHLHSIYTQNTAEQGLDLSATKEVAKLTGLDWIISTDHTSDFDNYASGNVNTNWARLGTEIISLNNADPSMMFIRGQEVALQNSVGKLVHFLGYPSYLSPTTGNFLGDGLGDATPTNVTVDNALSNLFANNGFAYAAHPFATNDELSPIVNGGIWNLGDDDFATNGNNFPETGGNIIANDPSEASDVLVNNGNSTTKFVKDALKGGQIWNERVSLSTTDDPQDPYNLAGGNTPFAPVAFDLNHYWNRFSQGFEIVKFINQKGLLLKNTYPSIENWKFFFSAGSDAHGSFNYSNTNSIQSFVGGLGGSIQNSAVGKVSTIAYAPGGMGLHGTNILKAMYEGNISLSDGPILVQGFSVDGNNASNELFMGQDMEISLEDTNNLYLNLQFVSTSEFGSISNIEMVIGSSSGEMSVNLAVSGIDTSLSMTQLFNLFGAVPVDEYFYIRHSTVTSKNYGAGTPQIITSESFHALTNPVWLKLKTPPVLPVDLLSFELRKQARSVELLWTTLTEINNEGFEVQHSTNAIDWHAFDWQEGNGNSSQMHNYMSEHFEPQIGVNYYRLKQVDFNGNFEYSKVLSTNFTEANQVSVYPNPTRGEVFLSSIHGLKKYRLISVVGELLMENEHPSKSMIDLSHLQSGIYFLELDWGGKREVVKLLKE